MVAEDSEAALIHPL